MVEHRTTATPRTTPGGRTAWDYTCTCTYGQGSYISRESAERAAARHVTDATGVQG